MGLKKKKPGDTMAIDVWTMKGSGFRPQTLRLRRSRADQPTKLLEPG